MRKRSYEPELLDLGPSYYTTEEYEECLHQLDRIGRYLGGNQASLKNLHQLPKLQSILDVGCGGGSFTMELAKQFSEAQILGIDISNEAISLARKKQQKANLANLRFEVPSSDQLSYAPNSFDLVTSTLMCHHLNDDQLIEFLKKSYQIAAEGVIINDLHRHWLAYLSFALIAKPIFSNRLIFHDGLLSIKRAFKRQDWIHYLKAAEIPLEHCSITWYWAFRWVVRIDTSHKFKL
jgi:2-polyprenyl-3-methyl-5-hydroxy-6-metoxy-1,4-benzoquinol methylase